MNSFYHKLHHDSVASKSFKIAKKAIMSKYNLARKLFDLEGVDSDGSEKSVIYISSSESEASDWETDCSTDTEQLIARIEREVTSSPMLIGGRIMTSEIPEEDVLATGPSTSGAIAEKTPEMDHKYFDLERCYASKRMEKSRIELCNTILPVLESPMSPPDHERGPSQDTPLVQPSTSGFHASYHIQNTRPYDNLGSRRYTGCMVCGKTVDEIKDEKINWYMERSTPRGEPEFVTNSRREAYINGLNAGSLLLITPAVSQAAACDGNNYTTSAEEQNSTPGTVPI